MVTNQFIKFLKNLNQNDWKTLVDHNWTIKDVVAHLVGWEKECAMLLPVLWSQKKRAWFLDTEDYSDFNKRSVDHYKDFTSEELLSEWNKWVSALDEEIKRIGDEKLKNRPELFDWVFDEDHYLEHFEQVKKILGK